MTTCEEGLHYCPNCDRSIDVAALEQQAQALEARVKELEKQLEELRRKA